MALFVNSENQQALQQYYTFHATIYDKTRWMFLFGRKGLVYQLPIAQDDEFSLLEIGVGTGHNLYNFANYFKNSNLYGIDLSSDMIKKAKQKLKPFSNRVSIINEAYLDSSFCHKESFDVVVFSYALSMMGDQYTSMIQQAFRDLKPGGVILVVDFHQTKYKFFENHMKNNHVSMEGQLLPFLDKNFGVLALDVQSAYWGFWDYFTFIGIKPYTFK